MLLRWTAKDQANVASASEAASRANGLTILELPFEPLQKMRGQGRTMSAARQSSLYSLFRCCYTGGRVFAPLFCPVPYIVGLLLVIRAITA